MIILSRLAVTYYWILRINVRKILYNYYGAGAAIGRYEHASAAIGRYEHAAAAIVRYGYNYCYY